MPSRPTDLICPWAGQAYKVLQGVGMRLVGMNIAWYGVSCETKIIRVPQVMCEGIKGPLMV